MGQIFRLTSFLNNLLNFLRVILENAIGSTDKYKQIISRTSAHFDKTIVQVLPWGWTYYEAERGNISLDKLKTN